MVAHLVAPLLGFVATGGPAVSRVSVTNRDPARMLLEPSAFFMLSKVDLSQFRIEREALDSVINEIDGRIVVAGPAEQQAALAAETTAQEAAAALAAGASTGGGFGSVDVVAGLLHPIAFLLPIPAAVVPMAALYCVWARLRSPAEAVDGSPSGSGLIEQGGAAAKVRATRPAFPTNLPGRSPRPPSQTTLNGYPARPHAESTRRGAGGGVGGGVGADTTGRRLTSGAQKRRGAPRGGKRSAPTRAAHGGVGERGQAGPVWGLAWNLKAARFHRKPSCEILPSGCTQAQSGASARWLMDGSRDGSWKSPGSEATRPMPRRLGCV